MTIILTSRSANQILVWIQSRQTSSRLGQAKLWFEGEYLLPIALHVDDRPALRSCLVENLVEHTDLRLPVIGIFAHGVGVMSPENYAPASIALAQMKTARGYTP
jgi:hypothetical protein